MLSLISPAKKLLCIDKPYQGEATHPLLVDQAIELARIMKTKSVDDLATLMTLSPDLAALNYHRYQQFALACKPNDLVYPALFLFQGDVYQGLSAKQWNQRDIDYAQQHLGILSGLYGLLKPLDQIQPYRLEMGVRLINPKGRTLYDYWQLSITHLLNEQLATHDNPILINLASTEYFKAVQVKQIKFPIVTINFYEKKNNELKMIGIHAKKARGLMTRYIMQHQVDSLAKLQEFNELGYCYHPASSAASIMNFIRTH